MKFRSIRSRELTDKRIEIKLIGLDNEEGSTLIRKIKEMIRRANHLNEKKITYKIEI